MGTRLFIAEKPSVAKVIIASLGLAKKEDGYFVAKNGDLVTWCFGHLLELVGPDSYLDDKVPTTKNGKSKIWRLEDLPILPKEWLKQPKADAKKQLNIIGALIKRCDTVVNCGDPDREGQLLVDEVLEWFRCRKPALRYWASAQDATSVQKALKDLKPNKDFEGMALAATGRQHADWLIGMNLTRAYTLVARNTLKDAPLLAVGRVQTPTLNLVALRDIEINNFKPVPFFKLLASFNVHDQLFTAVLSLANGAAGLDAAGRLTDAKVAQAILNKVKQAAVGTVKDVEQNVKELSQPLSLSLADVQMVASSKWGFSAQKTLDICQKLYEVYKLTTYPRSDCSYLPEVQHQEAPQVLAALKQVNPDLAGLIAKADPKIKSATWNDSKISAHHGIIPTLQVTSRQQLSDDELKVYLLIVKRYLAQFFPKCKMSSSKITVVCGGYEFVATGNSILAAGYKLVLGDDADDESAKTTDAAVAQKIPVCKQGDQVTLSAANLKSEKTKPPASFNEGTLIRAMENISTVVADPAYKKLLKDGDGIGTSATRAAIIEELKKKRYLEAKGKSLKCTALGFKLLGALPDMVKNPVLTAIFESKLKSVEARHMRLAEFEQGQVHTFVVNQIAKAKKTVIK